MDTIRVGFVGCGRQSGWALYPSLRAAGLDLVAVCDQDAEKAAARADEYHVKAVYTDYRRMCDAEQMDAVLVCIGPQQHYEIGMALLERRYHVWTEKPCSDTAAHAIELAEAATRAKRVCQTGFNYRWSTGVRRAKAMIESQCFGKPAMVAVRWWNGIPNRQQFQHHYMVHPVDLFYHLAPGEMKDRHIEHYRQDNLDYFVVTSRPDTGGLAMLELTANMGPASHWCQIDWFSRDGVLSVRDFTEVTHYNNQIWGRFASPGTPPDHGGDRVWRTEPLFNRGSVVEDWGYVGELDRFRQAVLGLTTPEATVQDAAWGMQLCEDMMSIWDRSLEA